MKFLLGCLGVLASIAIGIYVGVWLMFVGGVIGFAKVILGLLAGKLLIGTLAISIIKVLFAGVAGAVSWFALFVPSMVLIHNG
jgi:hypothetical protein